MDDAIFYVVYISLARVVVALVFFFSLFSRGALDLTQREREFNTKRECDRNKSSSSFNSLSLMIYRFRDYLHVATTAGSNDDGTLFSLARRRRRRRRTRVYLALLSPQKPCDDEQFFPAREKGFQNGLGFVICACGSTYHILYEEG